MRRLLTVLLSFIAFGATAQTTQLLGGPGIKVLNRGDFQADSILYLPRTLVTSRTPTQAGALRYQASDSALYQWTGTAWRKAGGGDVDTLLLSTRAWRQKGIDSLASVRIGGSGTINRHAKFTASGTIGNGGIADTASAVTMALTATNRVLINTSIDAGYQFDVSGSMRNTTSALLATSSGNVGIGTTSPLYGLDIRKDGVPLAISSTNGNGIQLMFSNASNATPRFYLGSGGANTLQFFNGSAGLIATMNATGLSLNTNQAPTTALDVYGASTIRGTLTNVVSAIGVQTLHNVANTRSDSAGNYARQLYTSGAVNIGAIQAGFRGGTATAQRVMEFYSGGDLNNPAMIMRGDAEILMGYTTDQGAFRLQVNGVAFANDGLRTGAPAGGTAATWKLGTVATVSPTSPNRTIEVDIGGTIYYIHAKTTND